MSAVAGAILQVPDLAASLGDSLQDAGWAIFGALLGALAGALLQLTGKVEKLQERRRDQTAQRTREQKEKEAKEADGEEEGFFSDWPPREQPAERPEQGVKTVETWRPGEADLPPDGESPFKLAFRSLADSALQFGRGAKDLLALSLMIPAVVVFYLVLLSGLFWLDSLMLSLGFSSDTATGAVVADAVLTALTGGWMFSGIRTRKRPFAARIGATFVFAGTALATGYLWMSTGNPLYAVGCALAGTWIYFRIFP